MSRSSRLVVAFRVVLLPLALVLGTVAGLGSYCEASDDTSLAWLFAGVLSEQPVPSVPLYFHGYGHVLAAAYAAWPGVPWLGVLLGALLFGATALSFAVLDRLLRPWLRPTHLVLALFLFFGLAWLEHWLWFSYVRVALVLSGASLLFAAQRPGRWGALAVGLLGLGAAWLMRPSLAVLGFGAALPGVLLLAGSWRRAAPLVLSAALGLAGATGAVSLLQTPVETRAQARDGYYARILDFDQLRPQPRTPADSLGTAAVGLWLLGDAALVNEALCRRAYRFDAADFYGREVPAKLRLRAGLLVRDYFPLLLALAATAAFGLRLKSARGRFWLVQLGYAGALAVFAGVLKLPPRLALPLLDFWLLTNVIFVLHGAAPARDWVADGPPLAGRPLFPGRFWRVGAAAAAAVVLLYGVKTGHRRQVLGQERRRHEAALAEISRQSAGRGRVLAGANDLLKSLSPFRTYGLGPGPTLLLTGWPSHDPSQPGLRRRLASAADQTTCLLRLAGPGHQVQWVLSAETARWLNRRFRLAAGGAPAVVLRPVTGLAADTSLRYYRPFTSE